MYYHYYNKGLITMANCSFFKAGKRGIFSSEDHKCHAIGTTIPEVRVTKHCQGDFFGCEIFRDEMGKEKK